MKTLWRDRWFIGLWLLTTAVAWVINTALDSRDVGFFVAPLLVFGPLLLARAAGWLLWWWPGEDRR